MWTWPSLIPHINLSRMGLQASNSGFKKKQKRGDLLQVQQLCSSVGFLWWETAYKRLRQTTGQCQDVRDRERNESERQTNCDLSLQLHQQINPNMTSATSGQRAVMKTCQHLLHFAKFATRRLWFSTLLSLVVTVIEPGAVLVTHARRKHGTLLHFTHYVTRPWIKFSFPW